MSGDGFCTLKALLRVFPLHDLPQHRGSQHVLSLLLVCVLSAVFFPAIRHDFINYDDPLYVTANPHVQAGLSWNAVKWALSSSGGTGNWHPLTWLSHMLDSSLFGANAWGHHLTSVVLHVTNTVLLFLLLRKMTSAKWRSFFVAALFGLHPLHVESVAWVAERKDVLSTTFWILAIWAYAVYVQASGQQSARAKTYYTVSILMFCLGLMAKPTLVSLPALLLLFDYWPFDRLDWSCAIQRLLEKAPFFAIALAMSVVTLVVQKRGGEMATMAVLSLAARAENALVAFARYLERLFWPVHLAIFYPHPGQWPLGTVVLAGLLLLAISAVIFALRREHPYLLVGWCWFLGTLVPVIGLVQVGEQSMADRYSYFPLIGMFVALTWGMHDLVSRWGRSAMSAPMVGIAATLVCIPITVRQIGFWKDGETVFRHAIAVTENNWRAFDNLASALLRQGRYQEAQVALRQALKIRPDDVAAHNDLAVALLRQGRFDEAIQELKTVLAIKPNDIATRINLGAALLNQGNYMGAVQELQEASRLDPASVSAHNNLAIALLGLGRLHEAVDQYRQVLKLNPADARGHNNLGIALSHIGHLDEAIAEFGEALRLNPHLAQANRNLGDVLVKRGRFEDAVDQYTKALQLEPHSSAGHFQLAVVLLRLERRAEAIQHLKEVLKLQPSFPQAAQLLRGLTGSDQP